MKVDTITTTFHTNHVIFQLMILIFFRTLGEAAGKPLGFHFIDGHKSTQFSFQLVHNLIIVPVKVNNKLTLNFILDTGTRSTIIFSPKIAKKLDLAYSYSVAFAGRGLKEKVKGHVVHNVKLELPGVIASGVNMVVLNEDYLRTKDFPITVHGVIGYGFFSRFIVDIDYENLTIRLYKLKAYILEPHFNSHPIELHDTKPFIKALLTTPEGEHIEAILFMDTGSGAGLILDTDSNSEVIIPKKRKRYVGKGLGGKIFCMVGKVCRMQIGNFTMEDFSAAFTHKNFQPKVRAHLKRHGSIGGEILIRFKRVVFNYAKEEVYIKQKQDSVIPN